MFSKSQIQSVASILKNNKTNYWTGNQWKKFENEFSNYHGTKYSVAVPNGGVVSELAL
jgi:dTDP-4-amino-4,6-dideoxygalactose transaminase